jgi:hypothetical protein
LISFRLRLSDRWVFFGFSLLVKISTRTDSFRTRSGRWWVAVIGVETVIIFSRLGRIDNETSRR